MLNLELNLLNVAGQSSPFQVAAVEKGRVRSEKKKFSMVLKSLLNLKESIWRNRVLSAGKCGETETTYAENTELALNSDLVYISKVSGRVRAARGENGHWE